MGTIAIRAGDERGLVVGIPLAADPASRPLAFSIVLTDREPRTGYEKRYRLFRFPRHTKIRVYHRKLHRLVKDITDNG